MVIVGNCIRMPSESKRDMTFSASIPNHDSNSQTLSGNHIAKPWVLPSAATCVAAFERRCHGRLVDCDLLDTLSILPAERWYSITIYYCTIYIYIYIYLIQIRVMDVIFGPTCLLWQSFLVLRRRGIHFRRSILWRKVVACGRSVWYFRIWDANWNRYCDILQI